MRRSMRTRRSSRRWRAGVAGSGGPLRFFPPALTLCLLWLSISPAGAVERVVALGGDITETVYAIGAGDDLVGVDSTSRWPAQATRLPDVGYVRQLGGEGVLALRPQLVLATHDAGPPTVLAQWRAAGLKLEVFPSDQSPQAVLAKIRRIGVLLGRDAAAARVAEQVADDYRRLERQVAAMAQHPRVLFLMPAGSGSPLAAGRDTAADRVIALCGGRNAVDGYAGYRPVSPEALVALAPQIIVMMRERVDTGADGEALAAIPGAAMTPAGKRHRLVLVDGQALLGFGPRSGRQALDLQRQLAAP